MLEKMSFNGKAIRGVLLDITGVLMESSSVEDAKLAIPGSVEAVQKLTTAGSSFPKTQSVVLVRFKDLPQMMSRSKGAGVKICVTTGHT